MPPCYSGPNPVTDSDDRMAIWKWAKANGIDHGLPLEKVHDAINSHFFGGQGRPEWINDILSGRKTPFRNVADAAWKAQYNRRMITQQARDALRQQTLGPAQKYLGKLWSAPRSLATFGHGIVFPVTHGGDLAFRPQSWGVFIRGLLNTWTKSWSPAAAERLLNNMKRQPRWDLAIRSKLDVGEGSHPSGILSGGAKGPAARAWSILGAMRFELWNREMDHWVKPEMSQKQILDIGEHLAQWANHATGSAKNPLPYAERYMFGPKLTASKVARLVADPVKTVQTFSRMITDPDSVSAGERAAAWTRLSGLGQYTLSGLIFLAVNQGYLWATGSKQSINFTDPTKSDWLKFKAGDLEFGLPGLHSEIRTLGQIIATSYATPKQLRGESRQEHVGQILGQYALGKVHPSVGVAQELVMGQDWMGRPMPWSASPGKGIKQRLDWWQYAFSHAPIPMSGPAGYVYTQLKDKGASALDAAGITKAIIMAGLGATGMEAKPDYSLEPKPTLHQAVRQQRAAHALQRR